MEPQWLCTQLYRTLSYYRQLTAMLKTTVHIILLICIAAVIAASCKQQDPVPVKTSGNTLAVNGSLREMNIYPDPPPEFPEHEGKDAFMAYCGICHTLKYIAVQPKLSPEAWKAEVHKMVDKFGAPIDSADCTKITNYLIAITTDK